MNDRFPIVAIAAAILFCSFGCSPKEESSVDMIYLYPDGKIEWNDRRYSWEKFTHRFEESLAKRTEPRSTVLLLVEDPPKELQQRALRFLRERGIKIDDPL